MLAWVGWEAECLVCVNVGALLVHQRCRRKTTGTVFVLIVFCVGASVPWAKEKLRQFFQYIVFVVGGFCADLCVAYGWHVANSLHPGQYMVKRCNRQNILDKAQAYN